MLKSTVPVSVGIPAFRRVGSLLHSLASIMACEPRPEEVIVHVDGGSQELIDAITKNFPAVRILVSEVPLGPGGSRGRLIESAHHELMATFDDDSYPLNRDYFSWIVRVAHKHPDCAVFSAVTLHEKVLLQPNMNGAERKIAVFSGCGSIYRKAWYLRTYGYVPVPVAYGMEEVDLSLQLHALGGGILEVPQLMVMHHDPFVPRPSDEILAYSIANIALFGYLRFPTTLWPLIPLQILSRLIWVLRKGWHQGIFRGLQIIPGHLMRFSRFRLPIRASMVASWYWARHFPDCDHQTCSVK